MSCSVINEEEKEGEEEEDNDSEIDQNIVRNQSINPPQWLQ